LTTLYLASAKTTITPDPSMGEECQKADLDTGVEVGARSLDPKAA
jgi:hypothetical protein